MERKFPREIVMAHLDPVASRILNVSDATTFRRADSKCESRHGTDGCEEIVKDQTVPLAPADAGT
jgi:hypothetical protein